MTVDKLTSVPTVEIASFLNDPSSPEAMEACKQISQALYEFGAIVIKDPRVTESHNEMFLNQMEAYFSQPLELKMKDARPEYSYQVGVTPELTETPRCTFDENCKELIDKLDEAQKPHIPEGPDPKWRFFWRIGERPSNTDYEELNAEPVIPAAFPNWANVMNTWGTLMCQAVNDVATMAAKGFDLPEGTFADLGKNGPHLLAPTGSDLSKYDKKDTIFAGFHYDMNFLTIHGKSRYPGLLIWSRNGEKVQVKVPDGCLLVQAGKQFEYLTGGHVQAGYHEVVVLPATLNAIEKAKQENRPLWRISSTLFYHIASDQTLKPVSKFSNAETLKKYPAMKAGEQVRQELSSIKLQAS